ncbi:glycosyl hydrolase [Micractinium conductrix]|uniref:Glycosyl hydrolase n=1 Tax=Micractinium conductrix TaxID=554055 RepID=A0A2P6VAI2_9CHLO|nr:glycosyl hydrolase [Micractinium conductrix]|eukprot:PSC71078.1 glycosyl hydrolase [Micractinium conductrix]
MPFAACTTTPARVWTWGGPPGVARRAGVAAAPAAARSGTRQQALVVRGFSVLKSLGMGSQPEWLPDFQLEARRAVLHRFFNGPIDRESYEDLFNDAFRMEEQLRGADGSAHSRTWGKADFIECMCNGVAPALPDFSWTAATDGSVDKDGYAIVAVRASGHHTGAPFQLPGLPAVPPSGRRAALEDEMMKVRVEGGRIREIVVLPSQGAGPLALYQAVGADAPAVE